MKEKKHILILPSWYSNSLNPLSGIFFKEQAEALAKQNNIKVGCIAINESSPRNIFHSKNINFEYSHSDINGVNTINILYPIPNRFKKLRQIVRMQVFKILFKKYISTYGKPDIVHLHSFLYGHLAIWIKENFGINYIVTEHSSGFARKIYNKQDLAYAKNVFLNSSYNIAVSHQFAILLEQIFHLKFNYLPNSIDTDYFNKAEIKTKNDFKFINIAFLDPIKNQKLLIESFSQAFKHEQNVKLVIVGDGKQYDNLDNLIKKLKLENQVSLYGRASRDEAKELLRESDAFVLSSTYETFGVVVIEAMSCGLPVVSTRCGGPESVIVNDSLGLLVQNDSKRELAFGMKKIYQTQYNHDAIRRYIIDNFSSNAISQKLIAIYSALCSK